MKTYSNTTSTSSKPQATAPNSEMVKLDFGGDRASVSGVENVNAILSSVGVRASVVAIPEDAQAILVAAQGRPLTQPEHEQLLSIFSLHRGQLLREVELAGRQPATPRGGFLGTGEAGDAPYPKIYDMRAIPSEMRPDVIKKYGELHINSSNDGSGIDELMTVIFGGPFTWFFVLPNGQVTRLTVHEVPLGGSALRLSYPGLTIHAGYLDPEEGVIVALAHGPEQFVMRTEDPSVPHSELLGTNPWLDFTTKIPRLRQEID